MKIRKNLSSYDHIFGPVPSRRLGVSLGVDLMLPKTCSMDCVYCECGRTTHLVQKCREYVPTEVIKEELGRYLRERPQLDHVTFSGSGEPTLHQGIGEIVDFIKEKFPDYAVALLTNSSMMPKKDVRKRIADVDVVVASLDAASPEVFRRINRPHPLLDIDRIIDGLAAFRENYTNQLWVEIFVVPGLNDNDEEVARLQEALKKINPQRIHLNTLDRPGTEGWVKPASPDLMATIRKAFHNSDIIEYNLPNASKQAVKNGCPQQILGTLRRRPLTAEDVSRMTGLAFSEVCRQLDLLLEMGEIEKQEMLRGTFYKLTR